MEECTNITEVESSEEGPSQPIVVANKTSNSSFISASFFYCKAVETSNGQKSVEGISSDLQQRKRQSPDNQETLGLL